MTVIDLIHQAIEAGVEMTVTQDGQLLMRAESPPADDLLAGLAGRKAELVAFLSPASDPQPSRAWLHLLVLADGSVIQHCGEQSTTLVEQGARLQYGHGLLAVVAVPGFERPVTESEIVKALAGTLAAPAPAPQPSVVWLARVARLLGTRPAELIEGRNLEQCDLIEQAGINPSVIAEHIRTSSAWIDRRQRDARNVEREESKPQYIIDTAATATRVARRAAPLLKPYTPVSRLSRSLRPLRQTGTQLLARHGIVSWS
jgi:hypothetical protein